MADGSCQSMMFVTRRLMGFETHCQHDLMLNPAVHTSLPTFLAVLPNKDVDRLLGVETSSSKLDHALITGITEPAARQTDCLLSLHALMQKQRGWLMNISYRG